MTTNEKINKVKLFIIKFGVSTMRDPKARFSISSNTDDKERLPTFKDIMNSISKYNITGIKKTDDEIFAESEAKRVDRKVEKAYAKTLKVWEKDEKREKSDKDLNIRKKLLEIRKDIKDTRYEALEQKEHFFSKKHV
jgi:hypothetical protein